MTKRIVLPFIIIASSLALSACGFGACGGGCPTATYVSSSACCPVATQTCNTCGGYGYGYNWY